MKVDMTESKERPSNQPKVKIISRRRNNTIFLFVHSSALLFFIFCSSLSSRCSENNSLSLLFLSRRSAGFDGRTILSLKFYHNGCRNKILRPTRRQS